MTHSPPRQARRRGPVGAREIASRSTPTRSSSRPATRSTCGTASRTIYSKAGFDSIEKNDLRGRMRWWGLYTQREQGYDGSLTGDENIDMLEAKYFMMRVRCDGGALSTAALRTLGQISTEFARDTADISDRENVQYHWIEVENVPEIWRRLDAVGLQTTEACGDCPRVVLGSPLAGESLDEVLDPTWAIDEIVRRYIGKPDFADLPRKYKTAISGLQDVVHEVNDIAFIGVNHPEHGPGLDLWVGGGLSTNPMLAQRVGAWVPLDEVPEVWEAVTSLFRDYGYRRLRAKARLKFLIKDWGIEKFREVLETEYLKRPLIDGPAPEPVAHPIDHVGVQRLKNGLNAVGVAADRRAGVGHHPVRGGRLGRAGRIGPHPLHPVPEADHPRHRRRQARRFVAGLDALGLPSRPSHWRRNLMACTGIEFCKLSFAETRVRAQSLVPELERRLEDINSRLDVPITVNINGCPNSCARIQVADIGFKGQMVDDGDGNSVEGFQVHLGGSLGLDSGFGRKLRQHKVTSDELGDYIERVVRNFVKHRDAGNGSRSGRFAPRKATCDERAKRPSTSEDELRELAERGRRRAGGRQRRPNCCAGPKRTSAVSTDPAAWATCNYVVASNMQDAVLVDLAAKVRPGVPVLFLDTGYHFVETIGTRDAVESVYDVRVLNVAPEHTVAEQDKLLGKDLFARDPGECCRLRKVAPLGKALRGYSAWVTGLRRVEAPTRANAPLISFDEAFKLVKINPLAAWSDEDMQNYIDEHDVLVNPLVYEGYPSIGCAPCTAKPVEGADPRSGRWQGLAKTECGLHAS